MEEEEVYPDHDAERHLVRMVDPVTRNVDVVPYAVYLDRLRPDPCTGRIILPDRRGADEPPMPLSSAERLCHVCLTRSVKTVAAPCLHAYSCIECWYLEEESASSQQPPICCLCNMRVSIVHAFK